MAPDKNVPGKNFVMQELKNLSKGISSVKILPFIGDKFAIVETNFIDRMEEIIEAMPNFGFELMGSVQPYTKLETGGPKQNWFLATFKYVKSH